MKLRANGPCVAHAARAVLLSGHRCSTAFLGEDWGEHTPVTQTMRLCLGLACAIFLNQP